MVVRGHPRQQDEGPPVVAEMAADDGPDRRLGEEQPPGDLLHFRRLNHVLSDVVLFGLANVGVVERGAVGLQEGIKGFRSRLRMTKMCAARALMKTLGGVYTCAQQSLDGNFVKYCSLHCGDVKEVHVQIKSVLVLRSSGCASAKGGVGGSRKRRYS